MNKKYLQLRDRKLSLEKPLVMGVLNLTPDSFYDGGKYKTESEIILQVENMLVDGANIIDIGGQSTRPNAQLISADDEALRMLPIVKTIVQKFPNTVISVDTFYSAIAQKSIDAGAHIINDVSGGRIDIKMFETTAKLGVPYILMHSRGNVQTMQQLTNYSNLVDDIKSYFTSKIEELNALGNNEIIIDVGFGFAKTIEQNFELLKNMQIFKTFNLPILVGISRKGMIYKTLKTGAQNALNGTTVLNTIALQKGANILRVHDVKAAVEAITLSSMVQ